MTERSDAGDASPVDPEFVKSMEAPAFWSNRFYCAPVEGGIRVALAEAGPGGPYYRFAFFMPTSCMAQLHEMLGKMLTASDTPAE